MVSARLMRAARRMVASQSGNVRHWIVGPSSEIWVPLRVGRWLSVQRRARIGAALGQSGQPLSGVGHEQAAQDVYGAITPQSSPTIFGRAFRKGGRS